MFQLKALLFRSPKKGFRADIQAMRAVAVGGVFLYHLWPTKFPGGFLGVDIFFVVSGFLMTSHILKGLEGGGWRSGERLKFLAGFYSKRVRRLAPAALIALASTLVAHWVFFREKAYLLSTTAEQVISSALFVQNWKLASNAVDYLAQNNDATAVEHFWSLSVEEQFYLVWPMLLMMGVILGMRIRNQRSAVLIVVSALTLVSFAYGVYLTATNPPAAYFVTPARLWELSMGGLIAIMPTLGQFTDKWAARGKVARDVISILGIGICTAAMAFLDANKMSFPGYWAAVPTCGAGLIIWAGRGEDTSRPSLFTRMSNFRPLQYIGDFSYSFYLWHFIVIKTVFFYQLYFGDPYMSAVRKLLTVVPLAFVAATLSYFFVEKAFGKVSKRSVIWGFTVCMTAIVITAAALEHRYALENGAKARAAVNAKIDAAIETDLEMVPFTKDLCLGALAVDKPDSCGSLYGALDPKMLDDVERDYDLAVLKHCDALGEENSKLCYFGDPNSTKSILLWGDSHAMHFADGLDVAAKSLGYKLIVAVRASCPPLELVATDPEVVHPNDPYFGVRHGPGCVERNKFILNSEAYRNADLVLLASVYFSDERPSHSLFADHFSLLGDKKVAIIQDAPQVRVFRPYVPAEEINKIGFMIRAGDYDVERDNVSLGEGIFVTFDRSGIKYTKILTDKNFCDDRRCYLAVGDLPVYRDGGHITGTYSRTMGPWFARELEKALNEH